MTDWWLPHNTGVGSSCRWLPIASQLQSQLELFPAGSEIFTSEHFPINKTLRISFAFRLLHMFKTRENFLHLFSFFIHMYNTECLNYTILRLLHYLKQEICCQNGKVDEHTEKISNFTVSAYFYLSLFHFEKLICEM